MGVARRFRGKSQKSKILQSEILSQIMKTRPRWYYKQSGVIPYRINGTELEILLVTSRRKGRWIIPKGIIDPGKTALESAHQEAYEEAGIRGQADPKILGEYRYRKWGGTCVVQVFAMELTKMLESWPEAELRQRKWMNRAEAAKAIEEPDLKQLIRNFSPGRPS
jgi:8-oxo-dGTP pyrophosphatase MutT (NUDIX family)